MKFSASLLFMAASPALSAFVLLPLYIYPTSDSWAPVISAVKNNPTVQFQIIINPNSGPGAYPPDANYIAGVSNLTAFSNVLTLGYVDTAYGQKSYSNMTKEIDTYTKWWSYTAKNISIDGIFFDDITTNNNTANNQLIKNITDYAYATVPSDNTPVILNPGTLGPVNYFSYCDTMIEYESPYSSYNNNTVIKNIPANYRPQSAILFTQVSQSNLTAVQASVHNMIQNKINGIYFTDDLYYHDLNLLNSVVSFVKAG